MTPIYNVLSIHKALPIRIQGLINVQTRVGDEMDAPLNGVNAPNWLTHTQLKGNVRHEN